MAKNPVIINAVVGSAHGGMAIMYERYAALFSELGYDVINVGLGQSSSGLCFDATIRSSGHFDPFARLRVRRLVSETGAIAAFCHCSRSVAAFSWSNRSCAVVGVPHSLKISRFLRADRCIAISPVVEGVFLSEGFSAEHIAVIPNSVGDAHLVSDHGRFMQGKERLAIGYIGRLETGKGIELLPEVLNLLIKKGIPVHALIAGAGPEEQQLKKKFQAMSLQEHVTFLGWINDKESFYDEIDVLVFPTLHEVMPLAIIEAFAYDVAVVTSQYGGFCEPFEDKVNLVVVPDRKASSWADAVTELVENHERAEDMLRNARRCYEEVFSTATIKKKMTAALVRWGVSE